MATCSWFSLYYLYQSSFKKFPNSVVTSVKNSTIERHILQDKKQQKKATSAIRNIFKKYDKKKRREKIEMSAAIVIQSIVRFRAIRTIVKLKKRINSHC